ncbi:unnamed protein product [Phytophthora lilii]|uniref:Unnamed protein product n=1 Tax=Phytophthora lilii TaxID=2077276 RepID=A0A9W6X6M9_9STRA|nr:unnamed protein product [Phytophthora lilii]
MARCMLYHEDVEKKWWAEAVNTATWIINRNPNSVIVKTPYEIVYKTKLKNLKVFGAIGYAHIPDKKCRNLDAKAFKCRFLGYEDGGKGYRVLELSTGKVKVVHIVKFMETTNPAHLVTQLDLEDKDEAAVDYHPLGEPPVTSRQIVSPQVEAGDVIPLQRDVSMERAVVPYGSTHPMITRSRAHHIDETTDPEEAGARKKQVINAPSSSGTKHQKMTQEGNKPTGDLLAIEGGQAMAAMEGVPTSYEEATTSAERDEWKKAIASELESLIANKTWKLVPRPAHQRPIGCRWVFALKHNEKGEVVRHKARLVAKGYSQRHGIDYEETYSPVAYLNSIRAKLAKCCADGMYIEQCDVDTAFLYGKREEEIYMELPEGLQELMTLAEVEGEGDVVCLLLQSLYGLKQPSRVWNETIDKLLKSMGFKAADADPCVYARGEGDQECACVSM